MAFLSDGTEVTDLSKWSITAQYESTVNYNEVDFSTFKGNTIEKLNVTCSYDGVDYTQDFTVRLS